jgi:rod shape-determining protein MreD
MQDSLSKVPLGMYGIVKTLVGYFSASVGLVLDVDHTVIRLLLSFGAFLFHQILFWMMERMLLSHQPAFEIQRWLFLALLNALIGLALFHFLDKLRETA